MILEGKSYPNAITKGESLIANLTLKNLGKFPVQNLDIQIVSSGFEIMSEKKWPTKIFANSTVGGQYVLKSIEKGTFPIFASASFSLNNMRAAMAAIGEANRIAIMVA